MKSCRAHGGSRWARCRHRLSIGIGATVMCGSTSVASVPGSMPSIVAIYLVGVVEKPRGGFARRDRGAGWPSNLERSARMSLPQHIVMSEVGPRDGLQIEQTFLPTEQKIALIDALSTTGLTKI